MACHRVGFYIAALVFQSLYRTTHASPFSIVAKVGEQVPTELVPALGGCALSADERWLYILGTAKLSGSKHEFGTPLRESLGGFSDVFISKIDLSQKSVSWIVSDGTNTTDVAEAILLHQNDKFLYVAGTSYGNFRGGSSKGISDIFFTKYQLHDSKVPSLAWASPVMLGTSAVDGVTALAADGDVIYAVGYTNGNLFGTNKGGLDAVLFSFDARKGSILSKAQFGTSATERAMALVVGSEAVVVAVEVERKIKSITVSNLRLYKFSKKFVSLGDVLLETFATESVARIFVHPKVPDAVFLIGTSKIDDIARDDLLLRRIAIDTSKTTRITSSVLTAAKIKKPGFISRIGGAKDAYDYGRAAGIHNSGRIIAAGTSH